MAIINDRRTKEEKKTHTAYVKGRDKFMSGWGKARAGQSYAVWACLPKDRQKVLAIISARKDLVNITTPERIRARAGDHVSIYCVRNIDLLTE